MNKENLCTDEGCPQHGIKHVCVSKGLQQETGEWAEETFPNSSPKTIISHAIEEFGELLEAQQNIDCAITATQRIMALEHLTEEAADVLLLLMHLAHKYNFNLIAAGHKNSKSIKLGNGIQLQNLAAILNTRRIKMEKIKLWFKQLVEFCIVVICLLILIAIIVFGTMANLGWRW